MFLAKLTGFDLCLKGYILRCHLHIIDNQCAKYESLILKLAIQAIRLYFKHNCHVLWP